MIRADEFIGAVGRLDAEVGQYLRHDARRHGRGHVAAGAVGAGLVAGVAEGEQQHDLRAGCSVHFPYADLFDALFGCIECHSEQAEASQEDTDNGIHQQ